MMPFSRRAFPTETSWVNRVMFNLIQKKWRIQNLPDREDLPVGLTDLSSYVRPLNDALKICV